MFSAEDDGSRIQQVPGGVYLRDLDPTQAAGLLQQARVLCDARLEKEAVERG